MEFPNFEATFLKKYEIFQCFKQTFCLVFPVIVSDLGNVYLLVLFKAKGQLISKQNCRAIHSPKKQTLDFYF